MTTTASSHLYSVEEAKALEDAEAYELVDGELKERELGASASRIEVWISSVLLQFARQTTPLLIFSSSVAMHLFPERPRYFRRPDIAAVLRSRFEGGVAPVGDLYIVPDLIVEVLSPNDRAYDNERKLGDYLDAGVRMIWFVYPESRTLMLYRPGEAVLRLTEDDAIPGFDVLPDFEYQVRDLFPE